MDSISQADKHVETWRRAKLGADKLAGVYKTIGLTTRGYRVEDCARIWEAARCADCGRVHMVRTRGCRDRLCPVCQRRRSRALAAQADQALGVIQATRPDLRPFLVTLTQRNVPGWALEGEITRILQAWRTVYKQRAIKAVMEGSARNVEITYNPQAKTFHPHVHLIVLAASDAWLAEGAAWRRLWADAMGLDYDPICDARPIKDVPGAVREVSKYVSKTSAILWQTPADDLPRVVRDLATAIAGRRLVSYSGVWARVRRALKQVDIDDVPDDELDALGGQIERKCQCGGDMVDVLMRWSGMEYEEVLR